MDPNRYKRRIFKRLGGTLLLIALVGFSFFGDNPLITPLNLKSMGRVPRQIQGEIFGSMPKPTQPSLSGSVTEIVAPKKSRKMVVRRIPKLTPGQRMPHGYWGGCHKCHLFRGGPPPGSQPITPVGKMWEGVSAAIYKVGPPILPDSTMPHPPSGRCIKCHDIVVEVPI